MRRFLGAAIALTLLLPVGATAQDDELAPSGGQIEILEPETPVEDETPAFLPDLALDDWALVATRAELIVENGNGSRFALDRIRSELVEWRSAFLGARSKHSERIATLDRQLAALGPVPDAWQEIASVTARREVLQSERRRLAGPGRLAQEAFARADGLIGELDQQIRARQTTRLMTRAASPANPSRWPVAFASLQRAMAEAFNEAQARTAVFSEDGTIFGRIIVFVSALVLSIGGLILCRRASIASRVPLFQSNSRREIIRLIAWSLLWVALPILILVVSVLFIQMSGVIGSTGDAVLNAIPFAGSLVVIAGWMASQFFPRSPDDDGVLGYTEQTRATGRWATVGVGWSLAVSVMLAELMNTQENVSTSIEVILFPVQCLIGLFLWWLGWAIAQQPTQGFGVLILRSRTRVIIGRLTQVLAALGPLAAILGFVVAAQALSVPSVVSLAIFGVLVLLQRLSHALGRTTKADDEEELRATLVPIFINFGMIVLSLPILAMVWGVSFAQLAELWAQFQAGFSLGETQISPTNFMTFILIFVVGYLLTGFIKASIKSTVLPRTSLDLGGQNAVVAGVGYLGVFIAAVLAITMAGIDLSSLAIIGGALSVGIGFGLQNIVSNFVSGIILLIERPIGEGDMIEVGGQMGYVREISVRSTRIETFDRTDVIVPNSDLVSGQVTNWTRGNLVGRVIVHVGVAYGSDTMRVNAILQDVAEAHPLVVGMPPVSVLMTGFGADSLDFEIRAIIRDVNYVLSVKSEMLQEINKRFAEEGIEIPFAQRDLWLRNPEVLGRDGGEDAQ